MNNYNVIEYFEMCEVNMEYVNYDNILLDISYKEFKKLCLLCWVDRYGFVVIVKDFESNDGRYRKNFIKHIMIRVQIIVANLFSTS